MPALVDVIEETAAEIAAGLVSHEEGVQRVAATNNGRSLTHNGADDLLTHEVDQVGSVRQAYNRVFDRAYTLWVHTELHIEPNSILGRPFTAKSLPLRKPNKCTLKELMARCLLNALVALIPPDCGHKPPHNP